MMPLRVSPAADADLDELAAYLARAAGIETALRFLDASSATFEAIARSPGIGERRPSARLDAADLRVCRVEGFENYLAFYRTTDAGILIVRVFHGARDLGRMIDSEDE